ncbi:hypothetical protein [Phaeodactylibacter xiamenensis]|uniref:hypothetical protein n=1 Tax=Phaeodactylibacter xiamenensis TaxID=1524460 RepID=UPI003CCBCC53
MNLKRHQFYLLLLVLIAGYSEISAQATGDFCATPPGKSEWLESYQRNPENYAVRSGELRYIPLTIHLVGNDEGSGFFTGEQLADALCTLNEDFLPADLQFFIAGDIRYISNSTYYQHTFGQGFQMMQENNVPNTVNCYFVQAAATSLPELMRWRCPRAAVASIAIPGRTSSAISFPCPIPSRAGKVRTTVPLTLPLRSSMAGG